VGNGLRTQARRVLLGQIAPVSHQASGSQKQHILEEFVTATGYARKYAQWLLNHTEEIFTTPVVLRRRYGPEVEEALVLAWKTLNRICAKRLVPFLPDILETLEEHGHVQRSRGTPQPASLDERGYRRSPLASPSLHPSPWHFDHQSRSPAQTADPDPHLRKVGTRTNRVFWRSVPRIVCVSRSPLREDLKNPVTKVDRCSRIGE
jgi:hypothetical protein